MISRWVVQIPIMFYVACIIKGSLTFIWISFILADLVEMFIIIFLYKKGTWESKRV